MLRPAALLSLVLIVLPGAGVGQPGRAPAQIDVVANVSAFMPLPAHVPAGATVFTFVNRGKVAHELSIAALKPGVSVDSVLAKVKAGGGPRELLDRSVGILVAGPGSEPDGKLLTDLRKGVSYLLFCNFRDTPEAPFHLMLGMFTVLRVD